MGDKIIRDLQEPLARAEREPRSVLYLISSYWNLTCAFHNLLYKSSKNNIPVTIQFSCDRYSWMRVKIELFQCFDTRVEEFVEERQITPWENYIDKLLDRQIEQRGVEELKLSEEKMLENHNLFQEIFWAINPLYVRAARKEIPILFRFNQEDEGVKIVTIVHHNEDEITHELQIKGVNKVRVFYNQVDQILSKIINFEEKYQKWLKRKEQNDASSLEEVKEQIDSLSLKDSKPEA